MANLENKLSEHPPSTNVRRTSRRPSRRAKVVLPLGVAAAAGAAILVPLEGGTTVVADDVQPQVSPLITSSERAAIAARSGRSSDRGEAPLADTTVLTDPEADPEGATEEPTEDPGKSEGSSKKETGSEAEADTKTMSAKVAKKPKVAQPAAVAGARFTTTSLNVRTSPTGDANVVTTLDPREKVTITEANKGQWQQIVYNGKARWVKEDYLARKKPAAESSGSSDSGSGGVSGSDCSNGTQVIGGTGPNGHKVHRAVCARFPSIDVYGGNRGGGGNHGTGRAVDIMVSGSLGWEVAQWVRAHASELNVSEVIYAQKIWTVQRAGEGWRSMSNRGSATANHYDHVHVSTY